MYNEIGRLTDQQKTLMNTIFRVFRIAFINFSRNSSVNLTAISIMLLVSLSISFFIMVGLNINQAISMVEQKADISIFLKDTANPAEVASLQKTLQEIPTVKSVEYISKEQALEIFRGRKTGIEISPEDNPLPASFEVKAFDVTQLNAVVESIKDVPAIESNGIKFNKEAIEKIIYWTSVLRNLGIAMIGFLVVISFMVIVSTIRLAVFSRKDEIEIMKLVGATDWFIRWPFIFEIAYAGIIASLISLVLFFLLFATINTQLSIIMKIPMVEITTAFVVQFIVFQIAWGALLGAFSSYVATHAHLKV